MSSIGSWSDFYTNRILVVFGLTVRLFVLRTLTASQSAHFTSDISGLFWAFVPCVILSQSFHLLQRESITTSTDTLKYNTVRLWWHQRYKKNKKGLKWSVMLHSCDRQYLGFKGYSIRNNAVNMEQNSHIYQWKWDICMDGFFPNVRNDIVALNLKV